MEERVILRKSCIELRVTVLNNQVSVFPLLASTMPKELLHNIAKAVELIAQYHLIKQRLSSNNFYTTLLVYFSNQGWLVKQQSDIDEVTYKHNIQVLPESTLRSFDLITLTDLYNQQVDVLNTRPLEGAHWEELKELRQYLTQIGVAIHLTVA